MSVLAQMQAVHGARQHTHVHVPEYGWDLYFPPMTVADRAAIREGVDKDDDMELMISALIHQARRKDGEAFFESTPQLRAEMNKMEVSTLMRITAEAKGKAVDGQDAKKS